MFSGIGDLCGIAPAGPVKVVVAVQIGEHLRVGVCGRGVYRRWGVFIGTAFR